MKEYNKRAGRVFVLTKDQIPYPEPKLVPMPSTSPPQSTASAAGPSTALSSAKPTNSQTQTTSSQNVPTPRHLRTNTGLTARPTNTSQKDLNERLKPDPIVAANEVPVSKKANDPVSTAGPTPKSLPAPNKKVPWTRADEQSIVAFLKTRGPGPVYLADWEELAKQASQIHHCQVIFMKGLLTYSFVSLLI